MRHQKSEGEMVGKPASLTRWYLLRLDLGILIRQSVKSGSVCHSKAIGRMTRVRSLRGPGCRDKQVD